MDKDDIKAIFKKARFSAGEGIKKAGDVAKKAASGVNDGLDTAKESLRKAALAKDGLHEIHACIKELEDDNKVRTYENVYEETKVLISKLKDLSKRISKDPENCEKEIDTVADECRARMKELLESDVAGEELQKMQVLSKRYEDALRACMRAKTAIETAIKEKRQWYIIRNDSAEELEKAQGVIDAANKLGIKCAHVISGAGDISAVGAYCNSEELQSLLGELEIDINGVGVPNSAEIKLFEHNLV